VPGAWQQIVEAYDVAPVSQDSFPDRARDQDRGDHRGERLDQQRQVFVTGLTVVTPGAVIEVPDKALAELRREVLAIP
jgi:hypothetical protein